MSRIFRVTRDARMIGTLTFDREMTWVGEYPKPYVQNHTMNLTRRAEYLPTIGLPADAGRDEELARTWGVKVTNRLEFVPVPVDGEVWIPLRYSTSHIDGETLRVVDADGTPRSTSLLLEEVGEDVVGTVVAYHDPVMDVTRSFLRVTV